MPLPAVDTPQAPWTYDLEIALFKAIMSYRPVGMHKSLRLLSILNAINAQHPAADPPITLQDIKDKLDELYDVASLEEQEESEEAVTEDSSEQLLSQKFTEFQLPFEAVVGIIEERGKGIDGDGSVPSSPEAQMSVRSGRSGRGTKRRREESTTAVSVTDAGTDEEGNVSSAACPDELTRRFDIPYDGDTTKTATQRKHAKENVCVGYTRKQHGPQATWPITASEERGQGGRGGRRTDRGRGGRGH